MSAKPPGRLPTTRSPGCRVGRSAPASTNADGDCWHVVAVDLAPRGRLAHREAIEATGPTEVEALDALATLLAARVSGR